MKTYLLTWESEDQDKIREMVGGQVTVTENSEEDAILKGSLLLMELIAKRGRKRCTSSVEDDGIAITIYDEKIRSRKIAELKRLRAKEIWEV